VHDGIVVIKMFINCKIGQLALRLGYIQIFAPNHHGNTFVGLFDDYVLIA
jgi:hypothetical protein